MHINKNQVKEMLLAAQGMSHPLAKPSVREDVLAAIQRMGLLQIDTISVVARSPYFVLWSRLGDYNSAWLEEFHRAGQLFEYYAHAACFIPIEQYPLFRPDMDSIDLSWRHSDQYFQDHQPLIQQIMQHIQKNGPVCSADFANGEKKSTGWWDWKEEKIALEKLWSHGELMVAYRKGFQRYYDLTENVFPAYNQDNLTKEDALRGKVLRSVRYLGAARANWVPDFYRIGKRETSDVLAQLVSDKMMISIPCTDFNDNVYIHPDNIEMLDQVLSGMIRSERCSLLSPFDPIIWDRKRTLELFDFEYTIECYLPATKRKYGYFSLPILYQSQIIGRLDAKAHRAKKQFEIKSLHLEDGIEFSTLIANALSSLLRSCSQWHGTPELIFSEQVPPCFRKLL